MKKLILFSAFALGAFATLFSQNYTFNPPSKVVSGSVPTDGYLNLEIDFTNQSANTITFAYQTISNTLDSAWYITLCDYQTCYPYIPTGYEEMDPLPPSTDAFFKLTVNPGTKVASGSVSFELYDMADPNHKDTLVFNVNSFVGVDPDISGTVSVYPNPSNGNFYLSSLSGLLERGEVSVMDLTGKMVYSSIIGGTHRAELKVENAAPGIYFVKYHTEKGSAQKKILIAQ